MDFEDNNPFGASDGHDINELFGEDYDSEASQINHMERFNSDEDDASVGRSAHTSANISANTSANGSATASVNSLSANFNGDRSGISRDTATGDPIGNVDEESVTSDRNTNIPSGTVVISEATKIREGSSRGHITYTIRFSGGSSVRRRYSEFESLRKLLRALFPCVVVPSIPEKHSLSAYAANPTHAKDDVRVIEHRRRTLARFLNRCIAIPQLHGSWALQRFLDPNTSWKELMSSERVLALPRSSLQAPPQNPTAATPAHAYLPVPPKSATASLEDDTVAGESATGAALARRARRINKHYTTLSSEYADFGGQLNSFSLDSHSQFMKFAPAIEKVGQAVDQSYLTTAQLVERLGIEFTEPLGESVQLASTARQVQRYKVQREMQVQLLQDALKRQRAELERLQTVEAEAQRMGNFLVSDTGTTSVNAGTTPNRSSETTDNVSQGLAGGVTGRANGNHRAADRTVDDLDERTDDEVDHEEDYMSGDEVECNHTNNPSEVRPFASRASSGARGFLKLPKLSHLNQALHGMIDVDPQTTRRSTITRIQENIAQNTAALEVAQIDARVAADEVQKEITRYEEAKRDDIRQVVRSFVACHIEWAEKNLQSWIEAKEAIADS